MVKTTLQRDKVISVINGKDFVGVFTNNNKNMLLLECSPEKADTLIKLWKTPDYLFRNNDNLMITLRCSKTTVNSVTK